MTVLATMILVWLEVRLTGRGGVVGWCGVVVAVCGGSLGGVAAVLGEGMVVVGRVVVGRLVVGRVVVGGLVVPVGVNSGTGEWGGRGGGEGRVSGWEGGREGREGEQDTAMIKAHRTH